MATQVEIAWAAGLFEGEGSWIIFPNRSGKSMQVQSKLSMTDRDVVERFGSIVGFGRFAVRIPAKAHWKPIFEWSVTRRDLTFEIIEMFRPYLGARRLAKADEVVALGPARPRNKRPDCKNGHPLSGDNLYLKPITRQGKNYFSRICRTCHREDVLMRSRV